MADRDDRGRASRHEDEVKSLTAQISFLDEEIAVLRRRLADSPRQVRMLEERLRETEGSLSGVTAQNERLVATLREARDQIVALHERVERLTRPPFTFAVFLAAQPDGTADVFAGGRKLRVSVDPDFDVAVLQRGQEVMLTEAFTLVAAEDLVRDYQRLIIDQEDVPLQIYVEDAEAGPAIEEALRQLLKELGAERIDDSPPVLGSWYKALVAKLKHAGASDAMAQTRRAIELQALDRFQAGIDGVTGDAVAKLIMALGETKGAVVQVGSVLLVKVDETIIVRQLTSREMIHWQDNPGFFRDPGGALAELQRAAEASAGVGMSHPNQAHSTGS